MDPHPTHGAPSSPQPIASSPSLNLKAGNHPESVHSPNHYVTLPRCHACGTGLSWGLIKLTYVKQLERCLALTSSIQVLAVTTTLLFPLILFATGWHPIDDRCFSTLSAWMCLELAYVLFSAFFFFLKAPSWLCLDSTLSSKTRELRTGKVSSQTDHRHRCLV